MKNNNDNFWHVRVSSGMLAGICLVLTLVLTMAHDTKKIKRMDREQNTKVAKVDAQIKAAEAKVDSIYKATDFFVADSLARHAEYRWVADNKRAIDSLRVVNQDLTQQAYNAAKKNSMMMIVKNNETVFRDFSDVPGVRNIKWKYYANKKKIQEFDRRAPSVGHVPDAVRAHFYTSANKQVRDLQMKIDSLLNEKKNLVR